jgi:hypothetical protein
VTAVVAKLKCMTHECVSEGLFAFDEDIEGNNQVFDVHLTLWQFPTDRVNGQLCL